MSPEDVFAAVSAVRRRSPGLDVASNPADVLLEAREVIIGDLKVAPPPKLDRSSVRARAVDARRPSLSAASSTLALARFYRESGNVTIYGYVFTALALAAAVVTLFNPDGRGTDLDSTATAADVVFVLFIGLTTLCGISNFQANAAAAPLERTRYERAVASRYDAPAKFFAFARARRPD